MRGTESQQSSMFSYVSAERRVPRDHPLEAIRTMADTALSELSASLDRGRWAAVDRAREAVAGLAVAGALYGVQRAPADKTTRLQLLFRWFVGLSTDDPVWDVTVFSKNRERLLAGEVAQAFFNAVLDQARTRELLSTEHFTVDGTLVEAWASLKSFRPKEAGPGGPPDDPGNATIDFHGERRSNATHQSTTDRETRLYKKSQGREAKLRYLGHVEIENRNGLAVNSRLTQAYGRAEPNAAGMMEEIAGLGRRNSGGG